MQVMAYDGGGSRVLKQRELKAHGQSDWVVDNTTHYTGIGTEVREAMRRSASPKTTVVVNLPEGLGRYMPDDAEKMGGTQIPVDENGNPVYVGEMTPEFEWYLKNHLGSTMLVYGTQPYNDKYSSYAGGVKAAYDYRATVVAMRTKQQVAKCCPPFGEQVDLTEPTDKVTENFTGKEKDDETELNYFGARYLDPMIGLWISVDPAREFHSGYAYGPCNPINGFDSDGAIWKTVGKPTYSNVFWNWVFNFIGGMGESSNKAGRKVYYSANSNPTDIRVRHITQQWVYDPNASDEVNGRHPFGTRRTIKQTKADERLAKMQYQNLYGNGSTLGWSDNMNWTPQIFDNSYKDFPSIELDYSNLYEPNGNASFGSPIIEYEPEPNGNVEIGELICATCSD